MSPSTKPNILLLLADEHRYDWHGVDQRLPVRTPNLRALARAGAWFQHAVTPSPLCAPARSCLALGSEYGEGGAVRINQLDLPAEARSRTVYRRLVELGYRVGNCGKLDLNKQSHSWGADGQHVVEGQSIFREWGFTDGFDSEGKGPAARFGKHPRGPYGVFLQQQGLARKFQKDIEARKAAASPYVITEPTKLPDEAYNDNWVGRAGLDLINRMHGSDPWFLQVNFSGPHPPMDVTRAMHQWYREVDFPLPEGSREFTPEVHQQIRRNYSAMVENIDGWIGQFMDRLRSLGILENTLVVYSSDHGEMLGDRELWKKQQPYQPSVGVPLAVAGPGVLAGQVIAGPATLIDLPATFLDLAGAKTGSFASGQSLRRQLGGDRAAGREFVRSAYAGWRMVFDGRYKLVTGHAGFRSPGPPGPTDQTDLWLVDLEQDPAERVDLAPRRPDLVARLRAGLDESTSRIPSS